MKRLSKKKRKLLTLNERIKRAEEWDERFLTATVHSLELYDQDDVDRLRAEFLSKRNRGAFKLTNPYSKRLWLPALMQSFLNSRRKLYGRSWDDDFRYAKAACALVTFVHKDWACADTKIQFDLPRAKQKVRNALAGTNFIASFDAAVYRNEQWLTDGVAGKLISFHCHAIVWMRSTSGIRRLQAQLQARFKPILGKKTGVHAKMINSEGELANSLTYAAKLPTMGKRTEKTKAGKKRQKNSEMTFSSRRNLFHALKDRSTFDFWLGGGEGVSILRGPRTRLQKKYKPADIIRRKPMYRN